MYRRPPRSSSRLLRHSLGYAFAAACLIWVFHDVPLRALWESAGSIRWGWMYLAVASDILSYLCQGLRWRLLLRPLGDLSVLRVTQAIYVGLFSNELLPMRIGELARGYLVSRWLRAEFVSVLPSMIAERFFDGVWLAVGIGLTAMFVRLPKDLLEAGDVLGGLILLATALFVYLVLHRKETDETERSQPPPARGFRRVVQTFRNHLEKPLRTLARSRMFYVAFGVSMFLLLLQACALWAVMLGYGFRESFWVGVVVLLVVHLGTAIPNAPANVGSYQFFCVVGLTLFGIDKAQATGFSVVAFVILTIPLWLIGFVALSRSGTTLYALRREIRHLRADSGSTT